jgi:hypoxanthine phosphoribosyltransferase
MQDSNVQGESLRQIISPEQIQKRVKELARQISDDYRGETIHIIAVLENGFMFTTDLVRLLEVPVICTFLKPKYLQKTRRDDSAPEWLEIFFSQEFDVRDQHVLVLEGLVHSGITSDFLKAALLARGAKSVKLATLLERQAARRVQLQPDYFGFLVDEAFLVGYGLSSPDQINRNLPFLAVRSQPT